MEAARALRIGVLATLLSVIVPPDIARAAWQVDGTPLCQASNRQSKPVMVPDGSGGAIVVWNDERAGAGVLDIYAQRIGPAGDIVWASDGIAVCSVNEAQSVGNAVPDGAGGAIVVWKDGRTSGDVNIYAQRLSAAGVPLWTAGGVAVCTDPTSQDLPRCVADGAGGIVVAWMDLRNLAPDIYAQRLNAGGTPQWTPDGVNISPWTGWPASSELPDLASDGAGGAIIAWQEGRYADYDIYAQRIAGNGTVSWTAGGVAICQPSGHQRSPRIIPDGAGGAILTWTDARPAATSPDIYAQRINSGAAPQWTANGVALCLLANDQVGPRVTPTPGGAIVAWTDNRMGAGNADVYGQCVNGTGVVQWSATGAPFCTAGGNQGCYDITGDGAGGAIAIWMDDRGGIAAEDIYAQRLDVLGAPQWQPNGVAVCCASARQYPQCVIGDGAGGMIAAWEDERSEFPEDDIYALRLDASGGIPVSDVADSGAGPLSRLSSWPNPFVHDTLIRLELPQPREVGLCVVDANGRSLRELAFGSMAPGPHEVRWDGRDDEGRSLPGGIYYLQLRAGRDRASQRLVRIR
jgi:hypothetical protein